VGLVFGGGAMRAAACAGVARVLEELGIRADVVSGTSAGSLAAALYAMGLDVETLIARTRGELMRHKIWRQPTLPLTSVMSAKRLSEAYREVFGAWRMEDMWITPFTISGNLTRAEMVVHTTGPLQHSVRASTAIAGVMPPALTEEGDLLIDGGIFNNTPADIARSLVDSGPAIAVDLGFTKRQQRAYDYGDSLSGWRVLRSRINPSTDIIDAPSIVSIMMRANALGSINATAQQIAQADLLLQPPVRDYGLFDFDVFDDVVRAGYEYARAPIEEWLEAGGMDGVY
jgi:predicted acylesterase/phospholipase RssA